MDQSAEQRRGEGTSCPVRRGRFDVFAREAMDFPAGQAKNIGWLRAVASGDGEMQMRMTFSQMVRSRLGLLWRTDL